MPTLDIYDDNYEFLKPIMFSAGLSKIYDIHHYKKKINQDDNRISELFEKLSK